MDDKTQSDGGLFEELGQRLKAHGLTPTCDSLGMDAFYPSPTLEFEVRDPQPDPDGAVSRVKGQRIGITFGCGTVWAELADDPSPQCSRCQKPHPSVTDARDGWGFICGRCREVPGGADPLHDLPCSCCLDPCESPYPCVIVVDGVTFGVCQTCQGVHANRDAGLVENSIRRHRMRRIHERREPLSCFPVVELGTLPAGSRVVAESKRPSVYKRMLVVVRQRTDFGWPVTECRTETDQMMIATPSERVYVIPADVNLIYNMKGEVEGWGRLLDLRLDIEKGCSPESLEELSPPQYLLEGLIVSCNECKASFKTYRNPPNDFGLCEYCFRRLHGTAKRQEIGKIEPVSFVDSAIAKLKPNPADIHGAWATPMAEGDW